MRLLVLRFQGGEGERRWRHEEEVGIVARSRGVSRDNVEGLRNGRETGRA